MAEKKKRVRVTLPAGVASHPNLHTPRRFRNPKTKKEEGEPKFDTGIIFADETLEEVKDIINTAAKQLGGVDPDDRWGSPLNKNKKSGDWIFKAHTGGDYRPLIQDAKLREIPPTAGINIGAGSVLKLDVTFDWYDGFGGGLTAYINAVQIIKYVEAKKSNFEKEDDGWEFKAEEPEADEKPAFDPEQAQGMHNF